MFNQNARIVVDLGFGDAGKGTIVDYLARTSLSPLVIRFNGGAQAAHNVVTSDGRHHTFAQLGSASFVPNARTHLSRFMLVDPLALMREAESFSRTSHLAVLNRLTVDRSAKIVTPFHRAANRLREYFRGSGRHGSCGMGIGETMADSITFPLRTVYAEDLRNPRVLFEKLAFFRKLKYDEFAPDLSAVEPWMQEEVRLVRDPNAVQICVDRFTEIGKRIAIVHPEYLQTQMLGNDFIFEGAQGVLLDEWYGFHPYTTWSTTTTANALALLNEINFTGSIDRIGVVRTYFTRHGVGPFVTAAPELHLSLPESHNGEGEWQGNFRRGWFDLVMARYALAVSPVDSIALTHGDSIDRMGVPKIATSYLVRDSDRLSLQKTVRIDGRVHALTVKSLMTDLVHQEALTRLLMQAVPVYETAPTTVEGFARMLEGALDTPISIVSSGPKASDKRVRMALKKVS